MGDVSAEAKKAEALGRMKELGINSQTIEQFDKLGKISISEPSAGAFFSLDVEDLKRVREFEQQFNALVYAVIRNYTKAGTLDSYLFVSDYPEEWPDDHRLLKEGEVTAYVYNRDLPFCSDMGSIGVRLTEAAGLRRTW